MSTICFATEVNVTTFNTFEMDFKPMGREALRIDTGHNPNRTRFNRPSPAGSPSSSPRHVVIDIQNSPLNSPKPVPKTSVVDAMSAAAAFLLDDTPPDTPTSLSRGPTFEMDFKPTGREALRIDTGHNRNRTGDVVFDATHLTCHIVGADGDPAPLSPRRLRQFLGGPEETFDSDTAPAPQLSPRARSVNKIPTGEQSPQLSPRRPMYLGGGLAFEFNEKPDVVVASTE